MALRDQPYFPLYVQDFLTDEKLNMCSAESQGVFIKLLCLFHKSENYGGFLFKQNPKQNVSSYQYFVSLFSKLLPFDSDTISRSLSELLDEKVLILDEKWIYQKRMAKDGKTSLERSEAAKKGGGNPVLKEKKPSKSKDKNLFKQKDKQNTEYEIDNENENNIKKDAEKKIEKIELDLSEFPTEFISIWNLWKTYKKEKYKFTFLNNDSEKRAIQELLNLSKNDINKCEKIINQSIDNGWKGLFEINKNLNGTTNTTQQKYNKTGVWDAEATALDAIAILRNRRAEASI